jgi:hypothetical protein
VLRGAKLVRVAEDIGGKLSFHDCTLLLTRRGRAPYLVGCVAQIVAARRLVRAAASLARTRVDHCERLRSKAGWNLGWVSAVDSNGRTIWIADAHRDDGKRFVVRADEKLTAFIELQRAIHAFAVALVS